ncbi:hypothetical protein [Rubinisphaera sp.]|uniref:hypothetical protein n=1 Tax=Rubinisphaera sp. TaxID=2024857 RepID=UPI000C0E91A4|nr:hypothetical protein [Rubinisphaera sp.]MBV09093.1 hypothetical protein [Rubinisphaera sp.]
MSISTRERPGSFELTGGVTFTVSVIGSNRTKIWYPARCMGNKQNTGKLWYVSEITELLRIDKLPEELK